MCSGVIRTFRRCSSGFRHGYSSLPRYFFASLSICASRALGRQLGRGRRPRPICRSRSGRRRGGAARGSCSRCFGFARPDAVLNERHAVLDVDPHDVNAGSRPRAASWRRRRRAAPGTSGASRSAWPSHSPPLSYSTTRLHPKQTGLLPILVTCGSSWPSWCWSSAASASSCTSANRRSRATGHDRDGTRRPACACPLPELRRQSRRRERRGRKRPVRPVGHPVGHDQPQAPDLRSARSIPARRGERRVRLRLHERRLSRRRSGKTCLPCTRSRTRSGTCTASSEAMTECYALQTTARAAQLFGADPTAAQATASTPTPASIRTCRTSTARRRAGTAGRSICGPPTPTGPSAR